MFGIRYRKTAVKVFQQKAPQILPEGHTRRVLTFAYRLWLALSLIFHFAYTSSMLVAITIGIVKAIKHSAIIYSFTTLIINAISLYIALLLMVKRKTLSKMMDDLEQMVSDLSPERQRGARRCCLVGVYLILTTSAGFFIAITSIIVTKSAEMKETIATANAIWSVNGMLPHYKFTFYLHCVGDVISVCGIWIAIPVVYGVISYWVHLCLSEVNGKMAAVAISDCHYYAAGSNNIVLIQREHQKKRELMSDINKLFGDVVFWCFVVAFLSGVRTLTSAYNSISTGSFDSKLFYYLYKHIIRFVTVTAATVVSSQVSEDLQESFLLAQNLNGKVPNDDVDGRMDLVAFLMELKVPSNGMMAGNYVILTKPFCVSFIGALLTFVAISLQTNVY